MPSISHPLVRPSLWLVAALAFTSVGCDSAEKDARIAELEAEVAKHTEAAKTQGEAEAAKLAAAEAKLAEAEAKVAKAEAEVAELEGAKGELEGELEKKKEALEAVKALQDTLSKALVEEIETGDIRVSERGGFLVVNVSDKVLFATGKAELSERGQKVISKLAETLENLPKDPVFQVGGHTDNQPIKSEEVLANFPTNWELSAARATTVVRFLEENSGIPGERLIAAGFSRFRPVASNKRAKGRAKNRRIEIALLPAKK